MNAHVNINSKSKPKYKDSSTDRYPYKFKYWWQTIIIFIYLYHYLFYCNYIFCLLFYLFGSISKVPIKIKITPIIHFHPIYSIL